MFRSNLSSTLFFPKVLWPSCYDARNRFTQWNFWVPLKPMNKIVILYKFLLHDRMACTIVIYYLIQSYYRIRGLCSKYCLILASRDRSLRIPCSQTGPTSEIIVQLARQTLVTTRYHSICQDFSKRQIHCLLDHCSMKFGELRLALSNNDAVQW